MIRGQFDPAALFSSRDGDLPSGWQLNGVPVNLRTGLLALVVLVGTMLAASVGYQLFSDGTTDMTLLPRPSPQNGGGEHLDQQTPEDLPP